MIQKPNPEWYAPRFVTEERIYSFRERVSIWWNNVKSALTYFPSSFQVWVEVKEGDPRYETAIVFHLDPNPFRYELKNGEYKKIEVA